MNIHGAWWLLACVILAAIVAVILLSIWGRGENSGYSFLPSFGFGCILAPIVLVAGVVLGLLLWALRVVVTIGGAQ